MHVVSSGSQNTNTGDGLDKAIFRFEFYIYSITGRLMDNKIVEKYVGFRCGWLYRKRRCQRISRREWLTPSLNVSSIFLDNCHLSND